MNRGGVCAPPFLSQRNMKQLVILLAIVLGVAACREGKKAPAGAESTAGEVGMYLTARDVYGQSAAGAAGFSGDAAADLRIALPAAGVGFGGIPGGHGDAGAVSGAGV